MIRLHSVRYSCKYGVWLLKNYPLHLHNSQKRKKGRRNRATNVKNETSNTELQVLIHSADIKIPAAHLIFWRNTTWWYDIIHQLLFVSGSSNGDWRSESNMQLIALSLVMDQKCNSLLKHCKAWFSLKWRNNCYTQSKIYTVYQVSIYM